MRKNIPDPLEEAGWRRPRHGEGREEEAGRFDSRQVRRYCSEVQRRLRKVASELERRRERLAGASNGGSRELARIEAVEERYRFLAEEIEYPPHNAADWAEFQEAIEQGWERLSALFEELSPREAPRSTGRPPIAGADELEEDDLPDGVRPPRFGPKR